MVYVLYNPIAGKKEGKEKVVVAGEYFKSQEKEYIDITGLKKYDNFCKKLTSDDEILICGGDGTLNRFINAIYDYDINNNIFYYATGSGNDFLRDLNLREGNVPVLVNEHIKSLPQVTVKGKTYRFINGVGYGVDGYCCEVGDKLRKVSDKPVNYTAVAIKGVLFHFKPRNAKVTVDGKSYEYKKVWIAPTMFGSYYGGGMIPAPEQKRDNKDKTVSLSVVHNVGKFRLLYIFPSIFKGEHVKFKSACSVLSGKNITVEFDRPTPLQIDGETVCDVEKYTVSSL